MSGDGKKFSFSDFFTEGQYQTQAEVLAIDNKSKSITIGIPKEEFNDENRIALVPNSIRTLVGYGHKVKVESDAGKKSNYSNHDYSEAGALIEYSKESNWVNGAASQVEGDLKADSTLTFAEVVVPVRTIAHKLKVSKQSLADSTFLSSYIEMRLRHGVNNKVENQIINGDGTGVNLSGWLATGNNTVISPLLTVDYFGLANKLKMAVIANDYEPDFFYSNPADWGAAETTRRASGDNAFVAASGAVAYVNNGLTPMLWGLPVVLSNNVAAGTLICKSRDADMYASREGTVVEMFEQDEDNVGKNLVTVRAETRGAELVFTAAAICTGDITGITSPV